MQCQDCVFEEYITWAGSLASNRTGLMQGSFSLEFRSWSNCRVLGCHISLTNFFQDDSYCLCVFCMSNGALAGLTQWCYTSIWDPVMMGIGTRGSLGSPSNPDHSMLLGGSALGLLLQGEGHMVFGCCWESRCPSWALNVGLCQRPQIFLCVGRHRRRKNPSGRGLWSRKHLGKSPTQQWHYLVSWDSHPAELSHV